MNPAARVKSTSGCRAFVLFRRQAFSRLRMRKSRSTDWFYHLLLFSAVVRKCRCSPLCRTGGAEKTQLVIRLNGKFTVESIADCAGGRFTVWKVLLSSEGPATIRFFPAASGDDIHCCASGIPRLLRRVLFSMPPRDPLFVAP